MTPKDNATLLNDSISYLPAINKCDRMIKMHTEALLQPLDKYREEQQRERIAYWTETKKEIELL